MNRDDCAAWRWAGLATNVSIPLDFSFSGTSLAFYYGVYFAFELK